MKEKAKKVSKEPQAQLDSSLKKETQNLAKAQREPSLKRWKSANFHYLSSWLS